MKVCQATAGVNMDFDFDCPQYVDFENEADESRPEVYFETRHTRSGFSPYSSSISEYYSPKSEDDEQSEVNSPSSASTLGQSYKTRLVVKKEKENSGRALATVSAKFHPLPGPPLKKIRKSLNSPKPMIIKHKRERTSILMAKRRRKNLRLQKRVNAANAVTVPEPFSFETDQRVHTVNVPEYKNVDFISTLRKNKENQNPVNSGPVRPIPERLLRKRKKEAKRTMAEEVLSFQQGLSNKVKAETPDTKGAKVQRLTKPMSPSLSTASRSRPVHLMSHEEKEILEAEEMKKYHFKAQPINLRILKPHALAAMKKFQKAKARRIRTVLNTEKRSALRPRARSLEHPPAFHARPVPTKVLQGVTGLGEKVVKEATEPQSPPFALKKRENVWKQQEEAKEEKAKLAAAALEAQVRAPKLRDRTLSNSSVQTSFKKAQKTVPEPFSFDARDQKMAERKEQKIQQILVEERKARNFRANPLPSPSVTGLPEKKRISPTKVQGFHLELENIVSQKAQKFHKKLEEQQQQEKEARKFTAQPCNVTILEPFLPKKTQKPATEPSPFELHSEIRAAQRCIYEQEQKQKEEEKLALLEERRRAEEELQNQMITEMRAKAVHKAKPAPHTQPFGIKHGLIPVTKPVTPNFKTDMRLKRKHQ